MKDGDLHKIVQGPLDEAVTRAHLKLLEDSLSEHLCHQVPYMALDKN